MKPAEVESGSNFDWLKWLVVATLIGVVVAGNSVYSETSLFYRVLAGVVIAVIAAVITFQTEQGKKIWSIIEGARTEVNRIVWPSIQERNQTTLIVVIVVFIVALILWGLDTFLGWLAFLVLG